MKELWLVCNTSLYSELIDRNEQRVNDGEIDFMLFPSEVFPFNSCRLPLDLNDQEELLACVHTGFGLQDRLMGLFQDLARLDSSIYDNIVLYLDDTASDHMFGNMICYFIDAPISVSWKNGKQHLLSAETREEAARVYREFSSTEDAVMIIRDGKLRMGVSGSVAIFLSMMLKEEFTRVENCVEELTEIFGELHPLFIARLFRELCRAGVIKYHACVPSDHEADISAIDETVFFHEYEICALSPRDFQKKCNEIRREQKRRNKYKKTA